MDGDRMMQGLRAAALHPITLWFAFLLVHVWLGLLNLYADGLPLGDVSHVYKFWSDQVFIGGFWVGIDSAWVYPILAIFPMLASAIAGPELYSVTWLYLMMLGNVIAFVFLVGLGRSARFPVAGWWWVAFLLALGPIALGRIDTVTIPIAIVASLLLGARPRLAAVLLTIGAWIKVWPGAIFIAGLVVLRDRRGILLGGLVVSAIVLAVSLVFGSGGHVLSFVTQQTGRGLQVEAPVSTFWMWQAFFGVGAAEVYYDRSILTWQVNGVGVDAASALTTPLMMLAVGLGVLFAIRALGKGSPAAELLAPLSLGLVAALIVFNKVGSPQFITWLCVPVILGLALNARSQGYPFAVPALLVAVIAGLTQLIYPYLYGWLLSLHPMLLGVLTLRNALLVVCFVWSLAALWRAAEGSSSAAHPIAIDAEQRTSWPWKEAASAVTDPAG